MVSNYATIESFYLADERRRRSLEVDCGVDWIEGAALLPSRYRVSWVEATGEVYAIKLMGAGRGGVKVLGTLPAGDRSALDRALEGWEQERCLDWIRGRLAWEASERP